MMDANSVGRLTALSPVTWTDGWPYFGLPGNLGRSPRTWVKPNTGTARSRRTRRTSAATTSPAHSCSRVWQWNHVPVDGKWSLDGAAGVPAAARAARRGPLARAQHADPARHRAALDRDRGARRQRPEARRRRGARALQPAVRVDRRRADGDGRCALTLFDEVTGTSEPRAARRARACGFAPTATSSRTPPRSRYSTDGKTFTADRRAARHGLRSHHLPGRAQLAVRLQHGGRRGRVRRLRRHRGERGRRGAAIPFGERIEIVRARHARRRCARGRALGRSRWSTAGSGAWRFEATDGYVSVGQDQVVVAASRAAGRRRDVPVDGDLRRRSRS